MSKKNRKRENAQSSNVNTDEKEQTKHNSASRAHRQKRSQTIAQPSERMTFWISLFLLVMISFAVLYPTLHTTARTFDDDQYFYSNPLVKNPSLQSAWIFLSEVLAPSTVGGYYQPLSMISLMLDVAMGATDDNILPFHRTSLLLHLANVVLIFLILYRLFKNSWIAFIPALIFGIHPMVIETITWVGERKTTLSAFFGFLALLGYIKYAMGDGRKFKWLSLLALTLSVMAKPTTVFLPLAFFVLDRWPLNRLNLSQWKSLIFEKWPFYILMIVSTVITYISQKAMSGVMTPAEQGGIDVIFIKIAYNIVQYLQHFLYPYHLTSHDPIPDPLNLSNIAVLTVVLAAIFVVVLVAFSLRKTEAITAGWLYFMIVIIPASGVIGFNNVIGSDKYAYFPLFGYLLIIAFFLQVLLNQLHKLNREQLYFLQWKGVEVQRLILISLIVILFIPLSLLNRDFVSKWKDTETYYNYMLQFAPKAAPLYYDLALEMTRQKRYKESIPYYLQSAQYEKKISRIWTNLGIAYYNTKQSEKAIDAFNQAMKINPKDYLAASNLGILYYEKGDDANALQSFINATKINPNFFQAVYYQGKIYERLNIIQLAMMNYQKALQIAPQALEVRYDIARMFEKNNMFPQAYATFEQVYSYDPKFKDVEQKLKELMGKMKGMKK